MTTQFIRFVLICVSGLLLQTCAPKTYLKVPERAANVFGYVPNKPAMISAHRGGGDYASYPENCVESFEFLAKQMPVIIECDIALTQDSVMVMMHDDSYERTTTGTGRVNERSFEYSQTLRLEDNAGKLTDYKVPTLERVLAWGKNKVVFTLDVKKSVPMPKVVQMVQRLNAQNYAAIITYTAQQAKQVYDLDPTLMISVTIRNREEYQRLHDLGLNDTNMIAFIGTREPNRELCEFLHQKGIATILGTLGNLDKMAAAKGDQVYAQFVEAGADILSSDRPIEAFRAVQKK